MNLTQFKRNDISTDEGLKYLESMLNKFDDFGPATISEMIVEAFLSEDENYSIQIWLLILNTLSITFNPRNKLQNPLKRFESTISLINNILEFYRNKNVVLPHFKNNKSWLRKTIFNLPTKIKIRILAVDKFLSKKMGNKNYYASMSEILETEREDLKIMVIAYCKYIKDMIS